MEGGIKIWVVTGDKRETAVNIGYSCKLLTKETILINVEADSVEQTREQLFYSISKYICSSEEEQAVHSPASPGTPTFDNRSLP